MAVTKRKRQVVERLAGGKVGEPRRIPPPVPGVVVAKSGNTLPNPTLGPALRSVRERNGWTLKEMSEHAGIPVSTLSKVERDQLSLTYDKIHQLCHRLNMRVSELFAVAEDRASTPPVTARRSVGSLASAVHVNTPNYDYFYLCPDLRRKRMVPIYIKVRAKNLEEFGELHRHDGEEWIYVVEGEIAVHTEFYEVIHLKKGEALYLDSTMGHAYTVLEGYDEAVILCTCWSAGDDVMRSLIAAQKSRDR
jgi:transcriptional regulator with XRE-family HTH domain